MSQIPLITGRKSFVFDFMGGIIYILLKFCIINPILWISCVFPAQINIRIQDGISTIFFWISILILCRYPII